MSVQMTRGIVSSVQNLDEYGEDIQIDAAVSPGASGSPLINMKREAIGVTTFGYIKGQNQNFAVSYIQASKLIHGISSAQGGKPISEWNLTSEEELFAIGIDLYRKEEYNQSIYYMEEAIKLNPNFANAWSNKGAALNGQSKYDEAIRALDEAIRLNPNLSVAWSNKGYALYSQGKFDEAIKALDEAIRLNPNFTDAWNGKGTVLNSQGKYDEAIKALDEAIRLNPNFADAWNGKGTVLNALGLTSEANAAFAKAEELGNNALASTIG